MITQLFRSMKLQKSKKKTIPLDCNKLLESKLSPIINREIINRERINRERIKIFSEATTDYLDMEKYVINYFMSTTVCEMHIPF